MNNTPSTDQTGAIILRTGAKLGGSASAQLPLLDCKCGGKPEIDWSGAAEFYGHAWQTVDITCTGKCGRSFTASIDGDNKDEARLGEALVTEMWNRLQGAI